GAVEHALRFLALEELAERLEPEAARDVADDAADLGLADGALHVRDGHREEWSALLGADATRELGQCDRRGHGPPRSISYARALNVFRSECSSRSGAGGSPGARHRSRASRSPPRNSLEKW